MNFLKGAALFLSGKPIHAAALISLIFFGIGLYTIHDYGLTTDEAFDKHIGAFYFFEWNKGGYAGVLDQLTEQQRNYGPLFDIIVTASKYYLHDQWQVFTDPVASEHFPVLIASSTALGLTFLFCFPSFGWITALLAALILGVTPQFIGHSQNNLKDMPLLSFFALSNILIFRSFRKPTLALTLASGILLGLTYSIRVHALIIPLVTGIWFLYESRLEKRRLLLGTLQGMLMSLASIATVLVVWPYYRTAPLDRLFETMTTFSKHICNELVLYFGKHVYGLDLPWHFPWVSFAITSPLLFLLFGLVGIAAAIISIKRMDSNSSPLLMILLWFFAPPLVQAASGAPFFDGIRHVLLILVPFAMLSAHGMKSVYSIIAANSWLKHLIPVYVVLMILGFVQIVSTNIRIHPYQVVYFNALTGGVAGAYGKFDLDYWGQSFKEAAEWLRAHAKAGSTVSLPLPEIFHSQFVVDPEQIVLTSRAEWEIDYKIHIFRGMLKDYDQSENYLLPRQEPCHVVSIDGAHILRIYCYTNLDKNRLAQERALSRN